MSRRLDAALYYARKKRRNRIAGSPANVEAPVITGIPSPGEVLTCSTGDWSNEPDSFKYEWRRDNEIIPFATHSTYELGVSEENMMINCTVRAGNEKGSTGITSESVGPVADI